MNRPDPLCDARATDHRNAARASAGYSNGNAQSHLRMYRRRKGEPKGFTWADYRDLIIAAHRRLSAP
jgi:hypothetical protein